MEPRLTCLGCSAVFQVIGIGVVMPEERRPFCVECRTTATPMWRGGPTGPRVSTPISQSTLLCSLFAATGYVEMIRAPDLPSQKGKKDIDEFLIAVAAAALVN